MLAQFVPKASIGISTAFSTSSDSVHIAAYLSQVKLVLNPQSTRAKMMSNATIECAGIEVSIREYQTGGTGNRLWPASHALLRYILDTNKNLEHSHFVELGAGVGLVSIALGKAGMKKK
jgi:hypothetical protein